MRVIRLSLIILLSALLSGCVTRVSQPGQQPIAMEDANGREIILVPVMVLPPTSKEDQDSPAAIPPQRPDREIQGQLLHAPVKPIQNKNEPRGL